MAAVAAYNILDVILIDGTVGVTDGVAVAFFFVCCHDLPLVIQRDLGVWHKGRKKDGVCMPAFSAFETQDAKDHGSRRCFHAARVVSVDVQTAGMAAGAEDAMELE